MHYAVIAAGEGSRLAREGIHTPKPLVPLNGRPMIGRLLDLFAECGAESVAVAVNSAMSAVRTFLDRIAPSLPYPLTVISADTPSSLHSFRELSRAIDADRLILTTVDTVFRLEDFRRYADAFQTSDADAFMGVTPFVDDEKPLYVDVDDAGRITAFRDKPSVNDTYISGGIYGLRRSATDILDSCIADGVSRMRNYQRRLIDNGLLVEAFVFDKIVDVDHKDDIAVAERFISSHNSPLTSV